MKLQFLTNVTLLVALTVDAQGEPSDFREETVAEGMITDVEILDEDDENYIAEFEDGKVGVIPKDSVGSPVEKPADEVAADIVIANPSALQDALQNTAELNGTDLVRDEADDAAAALAQHQQPEQ